MISRYITPYILPNNEDCVHCSNEFGGAFVPQTMYLNQSHSHGIWEIPVDLTVFSNTYDLQPSSSRFLYITCCFLNLLHHPIKNFSLTFRAKEKKRVLSNLQTKTLQGHTLAISSSKIQSTRVNQGPSHPRHQCPTCKAWPFRSMDRCCGKGRRDCAPPRPTWKTENNGQLDGWMDGWVGMVGWWCYLMLFAGFFGWCYFGWCLVICLWIKLEWHAHAPREPGTTGSLLSYHQYHLMYFPCVIANSIDFVKTYKLRIKTCFHVNHPVHRN